MQLFSAVEVTVPTLVLIAISGVASYGALGHVPPPRLLPNLRANYPSIV